MKRSADEADADVDSTINIKISDMEGKSSLGESFTALWSQSRQL